MEACIEKVGVEIAYALENIKVPDQLGVNYWIAEKNSLRAEKQSLRAEKQSLMNKEQILLEILNNNSSRKKENILLAQSVNPSTSGIFNSALNKIPDC